MEILNDVTELRNKKIEGIEKIADSKYYFYYDETENFGKFRLDQCKHSGFNIEPDSSPFKLGGIYSKNEITNEISEELIKRLQINSKSHDLKFNQI
ncbi:hypothetical protein [Acetobacterium malicum]|uniref:hypothetical protein n=1 Tax=Acetobacterium malicum TaxID=52692 RepID=UPI00042878C5|nr:hypothetical protein [Acetobacterium dehalogenans]